MDPPPADTHVLDVWYPLLSDEAGQQVLDVAMDVSTDLDVPLDFGHDLEHGNSLVHLRLSSPSGRRLEFEVSYLISRTEVVQPAPGAGGRRQADRLLARELEVDAPDPDLDHLRHLAAGACEEGGGPLARAERLRAAAGHPRGVEHFVVLCRLAGVPTRLVAGLRDVGGQVEEHLWAELFVADRGWVAVDPLCSLERGRDGLLGPGLDHLSRSRGQHLLLQPVQRGARLRVLAGAYAEADGRPLPLRCLQTVRVDPTDHPSLPVGARVPDLGTLLAEELELLYPAPPCLRLRSGATLRPAGESDWLYIISTGRLRLSRLTLGGRSLELGQLAAPAFLQADRARRGVVEAMADSEVRCLTREQVLQVARRRPEFGFRLLETFGERLVESEDRLEYLAYHGVPARLALALLRRRGPDGAVEGITHQRLGDIVGASRETVTKALGQFQAEGAVRVLPRRVEVLAPDDLARRLED